MAFLLKDQWKTWSQDWGLTHVPEKGWVYRSERVLGMRKGLLFRVLWGKDDDPGLHVLIRFPHTPDLERLREALIQDPALDALPGKGAARRKIELESQAKQLVRWNSRPEFLLAPGSLMWRRTFSLSAPKSAQVQAWVEALIESVARVTPGFEGRCETCGAGQARRYVVVDEMPTLMCSTCQQRLRTEGELAERTYETSEAAHLNGLLLGLLAAVAGAGAWAALAVATQRIFAVAAMGIGALVAWAYRQGAGRLDPAGRVLGVALTVVSVAMGEMLLYSIWISQGNPELGFQLETGFFAYLDTWVRTPAEEAMPLIFSLLGAWVAAKALEKPKLAVKIETAEDAEVRKAA
jgi:hypothetical protein